MTMATELLLIDIHEPGAPPWWPPAPGWWIIAGLALAFLLWRRWRRHALRRKAMALFDAALAQAVSPAQRIAAMSELLRRASRRRDLQADRLQGEDWLRFLDAGMPQPAFAEGAGRALLDGGFRRDAAEVDIDAVQRLARARFIAWMVPR